MFRFKVDDHGSVVISDMEKLHEPGDEFMLADEMVHKSNGVASLVGAGKLHVTHHDSDQPLVIEDRYVTEDFKPNRHVAIQSEHELAKERARKAEARSSTATAVLEKPVTETAAKSASKSRKK